MKELHVSIVALGSSMQNEPSALTIYYDAPFENGILNIFSTEHPNEKQILNLFIVYVPNADSSLHYPDDVIKTVLKVYNLKDLTAHDITDFAFAYVRFMLPQPGDSYERRH